MKAFNKSIRFNFLYLVITCLLAGSCLQAGSKSELVDPYEGMLHVNSCMQGASYISHKEQDFRIGNKSNVMLGRTIANIGQGRMVAAEVIDTKGCVKTFKIHFKGDIEKEGSLTGYGNDEVQRVIQVYDFILL